MTKPAVNPWLIAMVVSLATFMEVLDTTITNVSLRHIAGSLAAGQEESTWVLTSYLVANGIILPLSGWLSEVIGRKRFFIGCILGFTLASFFCGAADSLVELVIFRILQGAAGGGLQPMQQAIILDSFPPQKRGAVFAITGITMIAAPIIGPTLGGVITDHWSWNWIFYINVPVGLFAAFMVWRLVEDPPHAMARGLKQLDVVGLSLVTLGLAALQIVLDKGQQEDWLASHLIFASAVISFFCLAAAALWLWNRPEAIVDLSLLKDWSFTASCLLIFLTGFVLYGGSALLPMLVQSQLGYDATLAGMILSPGGLAVIVFMPLVGKLIGRIEARYLIVLGLVLMSFGMFHTTELTPDIDYETLVLMRITQVLGLPFLFIPISTLAFSHIPKERSNKASALYALFRNLGGSIGIAIATTLLASGMQRHQHHLAEHLVPGNPNYVQWLARLTQLTGDVAAAKQVAYAELLKQAAILSYIDVFRVMGIGALVAVVIAAFTLPANRPVARGAAPAAH